MKFQNKLIIFDCDGVLIDSEFIAARIEAQIANQLGHPINAEELIKRFAGRPTRLVWETILGELNIDFTEEFLQSANRQVHAAFENELSAIEGVEAVFQSLSNDLGMQFCVASTTRLDSLKRNLQFVGLHHYLGQNIFSASQVAKPKPAPDVYLFAAETMGFSPSDCLVFEDSIAGVQAARAANMKVIGFCGASHIYKGHDQILLQNGAMEIMNHFDDLIPKLSIWLK